MAYHIIHITLAVPTLPRPHQGVWLDKSGVESANIGTGVKKVWKEVYGAWGRFDVSSSGADTKTKASAAKKMGTAKPTATKRTAGKAKTDRGAGQAGRDLEGKIVKKIMMPAMPTRI